MGMISQSTEDFKNAKSTEPKKVREFKNKAKEALLKKQYKKAYKFLHKVKIYKLQHYIIIDEFHML